NWRHYVGCVPDKGKQAFAKRLPVSVDALAAHPEGAQPQRGAANFHARPAKYLTAYVVGIRSVRLVAQEGRGLDYPPAFAVGQRKRFDSSKAGEKEPRLSAEGSEICKVTHNKGG